MADATATPDCLVTTTTFPAPTPSAGGTKSPSFINTTITLNAVTAQAGSRPTPAVISTTTTLNAPTATGQIVWISERLIFPIRLNLAVSSRLEGYGLYEADGAPPRYTAVVMGPGGTPRIAALNQASIGPMSWVLNGSGTVDITLPADDPKAIEMATAKREIQIWRGPDLMWWGVIVRARGDEKTVTYQCVDLGWYFAHRNVGSPEASQVVNGSFEIGLEGWSIGFDPSEPGDLRHSDNWDLEVVDSHAIMGSKSLHIWGNDTILSGVSVFQSFVWDVNPSQSPEGDTWYLVAWCFVPSATYVRPRFRNYSDAGAAGGLGIVFQRSSTTETSTIFTPGIGELTFPKQLEVINLAIDDSVPKDTWIRLQAPLTVPVGNDPEYVSIQVFGPVGDIYWDGISMVRNEALVFNNVDQATIIEGLVTHAQDTNYNKSDLSIGTNCPLTGVNRTRRYEFFNHEKISDCIDEWPSLFNGMDWSIEITPTTRTFTSHYPRKGSYKPKYALVLGKNLTSVNVDVDGEQTANSVLVMADLGEGAAREEAISIDAGALDGLILELVYVGTPGSTVDSLQAQADRGQRRFKFPVVLPTLKAFQPLTDELLGMVQVGDVVPVIVRLGWIDLVGDYRIVEIRLDPKTEQMDIKVNPEVNWSLT